MKEGDRQLGKPARLYQDTKANIAALGLGVPDEGCAAYATDINALGMFDGANWTWRATPPAVAGYALVSDGVDSWVADQTPLWSGVHTHAANIVLDDGVDDSPQLQLIGGSNNDTVLMYLDDDAVAGDSDLVIRLCATDTGSQLIIQDNSPATVAYIDADGNADFSGHMAVGNIASVVADKVVVIQESVTVVAGSPKALLAQLAVNPGANSAAQNIAVEARAEQDSASNLTNASASLVGFKGGTRLDNTGIVTRAVGLWGTTDGNTVGGRATKQYSVLGGAWVAAGKDTTVTTQAMFYASTPTPAARWTITNLYGLYVEAMSLGSALNYSIYTNAGLVHLGDQVEIIGSAAADVQLTVRGAAAQSVSLVQFQNSSAAIFFDSGDGLANSAVVWNEQGLDIDFRVEAVGQANALLVQGSEGNVGIGVIPLARCHIDQASTTAAIPVLTLDQADVSDGFINFIGSDRGIIQSDSDAPRSVRVEWNGTVYRLALHVDA